MAFHPSAMHLMHVSTNLLFFVHRSAVERAHSHIKDAVDALLLTIVLAIRQLCPFALVDSPNVARECANIVPGTCVTTAAFTRNY